MELNRSLTATVYIVKDNRVLLHRHKRYNTLFPVGGHLLPHELPEEAAIRETLEETGLHVVLMDENINMGLGKVIQMIRPRFLLRENIGHDIENIDFIYYATTQEDQIKPQNGESNEFYWMTKMEIENNNEIKPHIKSVALDALSKIKY